MQLDATTLISIIVVTTGLLSGLGDIRQKRFDQSAKLIESMATVTEALRADNTDLHIRIAKLNNYVEYLWGWIRTNVKRKRPLRWEKWDDRFNQGD